MFKMQENLKNQQGQSLLEFVLASLLCSVLFFGIGAFLWREWKRAGCLYFTFENTHRRLIGMQTPYFHPKYRIRFEIQSGDGLDVPQGILKGFASCGKLSEEVRLPYLESAQW